MALTTLDDRTALVVIDLQNGIAGRPTQPHAAQDVVARTARLAAAFRAHGLPVVLVRVATAPDGADAAHGRTEVRRPPQGALPEGYSDIVPELAGHAGDLVVTKRSWGAFFGTELDVILRRRGVTQVVLTGIATSIGVESTARQAHELNYNVTLATDAMSDLTPDGHASSVARIFPRLGETGTTDEVLALLAATRG
ncbi:isochorismatase family protein [Cellulomonas alba]|uniref:Isochorismatase family protein n=1 Tax=Cellulomonas alba TaxID=3053467 RepID=A0ABT7SJG0_9CELL|nr:isochorismatase family protein [Cellulomonas alba]MDM7856318.1 isochorismatase family protein [Cellulomonas alba]